MMRTILTKLLTFSVLLLPIFLMAQEDKGPVRAFDSEPDVQPGTGTMIYTIPLITVQSQGVAMPISLTYNGSGLKVNSKASWVGQGWTLNAGGQVGRTVNGSPDDINNYDYDLTAPFSVDEEGSFGYFFQDYNPSAGSADYVNYTFLDVNPSAPQILTANHKDKKPDIFQFSVTSGFNGSFVIRPDGTWPTSPQTSINADFVSLSKTFTKASVSSGALGMISSFRLNDFKGQEYCFEESEYMSYSSHLNITDHNYGFAPSWHLSRIKNLNGDNIFQLNYSNPNPITYDNYYKSNSQNLNQYLSGPSGGNKIMKQYKKYIESITYDEGRVEFIQASAERLDLAGHYYLEEIRVFDVNDVLVRTVHFTYSYKPSNSNYERLFLESIENRILGSAQGSDIISFDYNSTELPTTNNSDMVDHWGYYNGQVANNGHLSYGNVRTGETIDAYWLIEKFNTTNNKDPLEYFTRAGSLEQINYSSGKTIAFDYELNEYSYVSSESNPVTGGKKVPTSRGAGVVPVNPGPNHWASTINLNNLVSFPQWIRFNLSNDGCPNYNYKFKSYHANVDRPEFSFSVETDKDYWVYLDPADNYALSIIPNSGTLPPPCSTTSDQPRAYITYSIHDPADAESFRKDAGGLRIKSISTKDNNGSVLRRNFSYDLFADSKKSSGILVAEPSSVYQSGKGVVDNSAYAIYSYSSSSNLSGHLSQNIVYYNNIEETTTALDANGTVLAEAVEHIGKTRSTFQYNPPHELEYTYPFLPLMKNYSRRHLLKETEIYSASNELVKKDIYYYEFNDSYNSEIIAGYDVLNYQYSIGWNPSDPAYLDKQKIYSYGFTPETNRIELIDHYSYENGIQKTEKEIFTYVNDTDKPLIVRSKTSRNFNFTYITTENIYPFDLDVHCASPQFNDNSTTDEQCQLLNELNQLGFVQPIGQTVSRTIDNQTKKIAQEITFFQELVSGSIVPNQTMTRDILSNHNQSTYPPMTWLYDDFPTDEVQEFTSYNEEEMLVESKSSDDVMNCQLINDENFSVASVTNGTLASSRYTSFESGFMGKWSADFNNVTSSGGPSYAVTGNNYYHISNQTFNSNPSGSDALPIGTYLISYWSSGNVSTFLTPGGTVLEEKSFVEGEWTYNEKILQWTSGTNILVSIDGSGYIDELRLQEIDATMETMGYYPDGKPMYKSSATGSVITYEYDSKGRLEWKLDRERNIFEYHQYFEKDKDDLASYNKHVVKSANREGLSKNDFLNTPIGPDTDIHTSVTFTDGIGRFRQSFEFNTAIDVNYFAKVSFAVYDPLGRELRKYLPYYKYILPEDVLNYRPNVLNEQLAYFSNFINDDEHNTHPYVETVLEASPLQRIIDQGGIGAELQIGGGHTTVMDYSWNLLADDIRKWRLDGDNVDGSMFTEHRKLKKTKVVDPDGRETSTYVDEFGKTVAREMTIAVRLDSEGRAFTGKIESGSGNMKKLTSYSVFDELGRLRYDIPFKALEEMELIGDFELNPNGDTGSSTNSIFDELITYYAYDNQGRVIDKHIPGQGRHRFIYDTFDRVIMTNDQEQTATQQKSFVKYDTRGRVVLKGEVNSAQGYQQEQGNADALNNAADPILKGERYVGSASNTIKGYTNLTYPNYVDEDYLLNVYYFDNYDFNPPTKFDFVPFGENAARLQVTRGLSTGSLTRVLNADGSFGIWLMTVSYYDDKKRPIQSYTENHLGGWDRIDTFYDSFGRVSHTEQHHRYEESSTVHTLKMRYVYDITTGVLLRTYSQMDADPEVLLSKKEYDPKGQLKALMLHNQQGTNGFLQHIDYRYNDQGRLTHINNTSLTIDAIHNFESDDVFGQELTYFEYSPEYYTPSMLSTDDPWLPFILDKQYGGNISSMMWNSKAPDEDGTTLERNAYVYRYDDLGQLIRSNYASDEPSAPGEFSNHRHWFDEHVDYDLGGNIRSLHRNNRSILNQAGLDLDVLNYRYDNNGYRLTEVQDAGLASANSKHFINENVGPGQDEYEYDASGRLLHDRNRKVTMAYNAAGLPRRVSPTNSGSWYWMEFMYDAAGNKLQKHLHVKPCSLQTGPCETDYGPYDIDYIGNFVYEKGELKMIYHPEGVIRKTPTSADNTTDYVYDYFIKDYLGNVRAVVTEENAVLEEKWLATMEEAHENIEVQSFDNIPITQYYLPTGYPVDASVAFNEQIARLSAAEGTEVGPSLVIPVRRGESVNLSTKYFFTEDAPGTTYETMGYLVDEVLMALATSGASLLPLGEGQLLDIANGNSQYADGVYDLLSNSFDTTDVSKPHAYLVWMFYDRNMELNPEYSGAARTEFPNELEMILRDAIPVREDGYLHAYLTNGSAKRLNFDNFLVTKLKGKLRQINDYYPYGLSINGINADRDEYLNKYTGKELQTGEFDPALSTGLEMFDFGSRFYDPQLGRWFTPDPAEQFHNPYLAMGNNPVMYVDPDGEFAIWDDVIVAGVGFAVGYVGYGLRNGDWGGKAFEAGGVGAATALLSYYTGGGYSVAAGGTMSGVGSFAGNYAISSVVNSFLPSIDVPITSDFSVSMSLGLSVGSSGLGGGINVSGNYNSDDFSASFGYGAGEGNTGSYSGYGVSVRIGEFGGGYNRTTYSGSNSQVVGGVSLSYKNLAFRLENDFFGDKHDRWRSNAAEITIGDFVVGTNLYNNEVDTKADPNFDGRNLLEKSNREPFGAWKDGQTYSSPLWVGFKSNGSVYRFGYSHPLVQDRTQNAIHKWFGPGRTNFFNRYDNFQRGTYNYYGYDNPYSLW